MRHRYAYILALLLYIPLSSKAQNAPLQFVANKGQWNAPFLFKAASSDVDVYLEKAGFTYVVGAHDNNELAHAYKHGELKTAPTLRYHAYKVHLLGAKENPRVTTAKALPHYHNYYLGQDPTRWQSGIYPCLNVDYHNIYSGIDLHISSENQQLKYDFIVKPGADPTDIVLAYEGVDGMKLRNGNLEITTSVGIIKELKPYVYQYIDNQKVEVPCNYVFNATNNSISYQFPKGYNKTTNLIIDPTVVFATFSGSTADNWGFTATYDQQGNFYGGGTVYGVGYPATPGAFQASFGGGGSGGGTGLQFDIGISKFTPSGNALVYSTYLGGSDNEQPHSLIVDPTGNLIVAGRTYSHNFPVQNAYDATHNGLADIIVTKFNNNGTALLGSTFVGGTGDDGVNISSVSVVTSLKHNYGDDARSEVITDWAGNVYVAASTFSNDFPVTSTATQNSLQGLQDGVVFKLTPALDALTWSTYLGGTNDDAAYVLAVNPSGSHLYVAGGTSSTNFPVTTGTLNPNYKGGLADGFILKFLNSGNYTLQKGTFIGEFDYDQCYGIQVDDENHVYAMGQTLGGTFPVTPGTYNNPGSSQFVIKLDSNLANIVYSTVFGSGNSFAANISPVAFLVDTCEQVYISGWGGPLSQNGGNTFNMPVTPDAAQSTTDGSDFYFIVFAKDAVNLLYATYYGGATLGEHVDGGTSRFDKNGVVYQGICGGCGGSSAVPTTPGTHSPQNQSSNCNFLALKIAFELGSVAATASVSPDTSGCPPFTVSFQSSSGNATAFEWDFGDGSPVDTSAIPAPHTFNDPGVYTVRLIVKNPNACIVTVDTAYLTIVVDTNTIIANYTHMTTDSCDPYIATFTNTSKFGNTPNAQANTTFIWSFDDGTPDFVGQNPPPHTFPDSGCYNVRLIMIDSLSCNKADTIVKQICLYGFILDAAFDAPDSLCFGTSAQMVNQSTNSQSSTWDFGDGHTVGGLAPAYTYPAPGTYTITLVSSHPDACNKTDTARRTIKIFPAPIANFDHNPLIPEANKPVQFTNRSTNAVAYRWSFGDGAGSTEENPSHLYKRTGTYTVCLSASNEGGCPDTLCKKVDAEIYPAVDVPTGFSPNGDGSNDILYVRGAGIEKLNFKVYNRWGQLVFESNDEKMGWDGNFKGQPQEMETYAWVLSVTFVDGSNTERSGNVTLLR